MTTYRYADLPVATPAPGMDRRQVYTEHMMVTVVDFTGGPSPAVPTHNHPHEQISYMVSGKVIFIIDTEDGRTMDELAPGDMVVVPPNAPHTVELLSESARVVDCFYPIREDFLP
jgi:quercetin dioxygenase-like cupin family protein